MIKPVTHRSPETQRPNAPSDAESIVSIPFARIASDLTPPRPRNKAETATINRIARLYQAEASESGCFQLRTSLPLAGMSPPGSSRPSGEPMTTIEVVTTARLAEAVRGLSQRSGKVYVAMTNKDGVEYALANVPAGRVGIMDPYGHILRESLDELIAAGVSG